MRAERGCLSAHLRARSPAARRQSSAAASFATDEKPDIQQGPDGNLYVVSITDRAIYMISRQ